MGVHKKGSRAENRGRAGGNRENLHEATAPEDPATSFRPAARMPQGPRLVVPERGGLKTGGGGDAMNAQGHAPPSLRRRRTAAGQVVRSDARSAMLSICGHSET